MSLWWSLGLLSRMRELSALTSWVDTIWLGLLETATEINPLRVSSVRSQISVFRTVTDVTSRVFTTQQPTLHAKIYALPFQLRTRS